MIQNGILYLKKQPTESTCEKKSILLTNAHDVVIFDLNGQEIEETTLKCIVTAENVCLIKKKIKYTFLKKKAN